MNILKLFVSKFMVGKPIITKCGTQITRYKKGNDIYKKVIFGNGNEQAQKLGLRSYITKTSENGEKTFSGIIKTSNEDDKLIIKSPLTLGIIVDRLKEGLTLEQAIYIEKMMSKAKKIFKSQ